MTCGLQDSKDTSTAHSSLRVLFACLLRTPREHVCAIVIVQVDRSTLREVDVVGWVGGYREQQQVAASSSG